MKIWTFLSVKADISCLDFPALSCTLQYITIVFQGTFWPLLPWIVMEFVRLFAKLIFFIMVIIVWAIYMGEGEDTSNIIATGVIGAAVMGTYQNTKITLSFDIFEITSQLFQLSSTTYGFVLSAIFNFYGKSIKSEICTRSKIPQVIKLPLLWLQIMIMKTPMTTCPNILPKSLLMGMMLHLSKVKLTPKVRCQMGLQTRQAQQRQMNDTEMSISRHYFNLCQFTNFSTFTIEKCCEQINYSALQKKWLKLDYLSENWTRIG